MVFMGAPGAGKGTQAIRVSQAYGVPHISTGDIFRQQMEEGTELGNSVRPFLAEGHLAPDEVAVAVVCERLKEADCSEGYILDGFPRSLGQAQALDKLLETRGESLDVVLNLRADDEELIERLSQRRSCPNCGTIYNLKFSPPKQKDTCDNPECNGTELLHRVDDYPETIRERLNVYHQTTGPILEYYRSRGALKEVQGAGSTPDSVFATIDSLIVQAGA